MKKIIKGITTHTIAFVLGAIIFTIIGAYAATTLASSAVAYNNSTSGSTKTTVQGAIDELYEMAEEKNAKLIAYTYNEDSTAANYCITGNEKTCEKNTCYENSAAGSCPAGTIIDYMVNDYDRVRFHVMYDNGSTLTMQTQMNTVYNVPWISKGDYIVANSNNTTCAYDACQDEGPLTTLTSLESVTANWTNVNDQTYTLGATIFKTNAYTKCSSYNSCSSNSYTLDTKNVKARIISLQEAVDLGCTDAYPSCPIWMYNYLYLSKDYNGTVNDSSFANNSVQNAGYWIINGGDYTHAAWIIYTTGRINYNSLYSNNIGARAVVEINK